MATIELKFWWNDVRLSRICRHRRFRRRQGITQHLRFPLERTESYHYLWEWRALVRMSPVWNLWFHCMAPQFPISFLVNSINLPEMLDDLITHRFFIITLFNTKHQLFDRDRNRARREREHKLDVEQSIGKPENTNWILATRWAFRINWFFCEVIRVCTHTHKARFLMDYLIFACDRSWHSIVIEMKCWRLNFTHYTWLRSPIWLCESIWIFAQRFDSLRLLLLMLLCVCVWVMCMLQRFVSGSIRLVYWHRATDKIQRIRNEAKKKLTSIQKTNEKKRKKSSNKIEIAQTPSRHTHT